MLNPLVTYEYSSFRALQEFIDSFQERNCKYYASEVFKDENFDEEETIYKAIDRAIKACISINLSVGQHFKTVYKSVNDDIYIDWKMSAFGCYLALINGDPTNPMIARLQMEIISFYFKNNRQEIH